MSPSRGGEITTWALLALALPSAASAILNNAYRVIDQFSVQWLGVAAQAALGSSTFVLIAVYGLFILVSAGAGPLVARATGAVDPVQRRKIVGSALGLAVGMGLLVSAVLALASPLLAGLIGLEGAPAEALVAYLRALAVGGVVFALAPLVDACFFAMGNAAFPLLLQVVFTLANGLLNWLLIYEWGLGLAGAGYASVLARGLTTAIALGGLWRTIRWRLSDLRPDGMALRIVRVGSPIALNVLAYALVYWVLLRVAISPLGPAVNAALGVGFSALEGVSWPIFHGIELAVASMVGRQLGAGRPDRAQAAVRLALPWSLGAGLVASVVFYVAAVPLCALFTEDPQVLEQAVLYARILAFSQLFVAIEALSEGTLSGAGDTRSVFWWSMPLNALRVPLGWFLALHLGMGAAGVWWAINLTTYLKAAGKGSAVLRGKWRYTQV